MATFFGRAFLGQCLRSRRRQALLVSMACLALHGVSFANSDLGVRAQSFGSAFRAVASANDIIFYNPAGLIKHRRTASDFDYLLNTDARHHQLGASLMDAETTSWGLGLAYSAGLDRKTEIASKHLLYLAMAMPVLADMFSIGASLSYRYDNTTYEVPHRHFFNMDLGALIDLSMGLSFAVVLDHFLPAKENEKPMGLSLGSAFEVEELVNYLPLTFSFDWLMDNVESDAELGHIVGFGLEYVAFSMLPLRLGYKSILNENDNLLSMGTGIKTEGVAFDALYQQHLTIGRIRYFGIALRLNI